MNTKKEHISYLKIKDLDVQVIRKDIKNYHINVLPYDGEVRVSVPFHVSDETIKAFVIRKYDKIKKYINDFRNQERQTPREYVSGESHYFRGRRYIMKLEQAKRPGIVIKGKYIYFSVPEHYSLKHKQQYYENWLRKQLRQDLLILVPKWEKITGSKTSEVKIKKMKTHWGTCNPEDKRIWINLDLIKKPQKHLEYIILHELIHLTERHHNERFRTLMEQFMPNWKSIRQELNEFIL